MNRTGHHTFDEDLIAFAREELRTLNLDGADRNSAVQCGQSQCEQRPRNRHDAILMLDCQDSFLPSVLLHHEASIPEND